MIIEEYTKRKSCFIYNCKEYNEEEQKHFYAELMQDEYLNKLKTNTDLLKICIFGKRFNFIKTKRGGENENRKTKN